MLSRVHYSNPALGKMVLYSTHVRCCTSHGICHPSWRYIIAQAVAAAVRALAPKCFARNRMDHVFDSWLLRVDPCLLIFADNKRDKNISVQSTDTAGGGWCSRLVSEHLPVFGLFVIIHKLKKVGEKRVGLHDTRIFHRDHPLIPVQIPTRYIYYAEVI